MGHGDDGEDLHRHELIIVHTIYTFLGVVFNSVAASQALSWRKATANNPHVGNLFLVVSWLLVMASVAGADEGDEAGSYTFFTLVFALVTLKGGIIKHMRTPYARMPEYHPHAWQFGVAINLYGLAAYLYGCVMAIVAGALESAAFWVWLVLAVIVVVLLHVRKAKQGTPSDAAWYNQKGGLTAVHTTKRHVEMTSYYVTMSDGVRIAVDVHLPLWWGKPGVPSPKLPTILHLTRYNRNWKVRPFWRWLLGPYFNMRSLRYVQKLIPRGFAWVSVDVRATGASFGSKACDLLPRETDDYQEVLAWVKQQRWCNGSVGTGGISYDGITGTLLASGGGVKAVASVFAPQDIFRDLVAAGGVLAQGFVDTYGKFTRASERNEHVQGVKVPKLYSFLTHWVVDGVLPVNGDDAALEAALAEHRQNWDMTVKLRDCHYMDSPLVAVPKAGLDLSKVDPNTIAASAESSDSVTLTPGFFGLNTPRVINGLIENKVVVHSWTGYFDSCQTVSTARLHTQLPPGFSHITMGPWSHGGRRNCSAHSPHPGPAFDIFEDIARFFVRELVDKQHGSSGRQSDEAGIHYFVMGLEQWRTAPAWPVPGRHVRRMVFGPQQRLLDDSETVPEQDVAFDVPMNASSGVVSRWNLTQALFMKVISAGDRAQQDRLLRVYDSEPLHASLVVTGQPLLRLVLQPNKPDAVVFAYLEDVAPDGRVVCVTEGVMRASSRPGDPAAATAASGTAGDESKTAPAGDADSFGDPVDDDDVAETKHVVVQGTPAHVDGGEPGVDACVSYSFTQGMNKPLSTTSPEVVDIPLITTSYYFAAGHRVRIALSGSDLDNFDTSCLPTELATEWRLRHGPSGCSLQLPLEGGSSGDAAAAGRALPSV